MDMLVSKDESASQISDKIKDLLFAKSAENIESIRPNVAASIFDEPEVESELDQEVEEIEDGDESSEKE